MFGGLKFSMFRALGFPHGGDMHNRIKPAFLASIVLVAVTAFAENPFAGTWKVDVSKSKMTGSTVTFASAGPGEVRHTAGGQSYNFKLDGSDATTPIGDTARKSRLRWR
jgi:hypothetical protein